MRPPQWADLERDIVEATNSLVHWEAEAVKVKAGYSQDRERLMQASQRFAERCKDMGCRVEFVAHPPELEDDDGA